jgi:ATP-dependent RNA helicase DDX5/DBP2
MLILDEADRMALNRDLCEQVNQILELVFSSSADSSRTSSASNIPTVLCSATWPDRVTETWRQWVHATAHKPCVVVKVDALVLGQKLPANNQPNSAEAPQDGSEETSEIGKTTTSVDSKSRALLLSQIPANLTQTLHVCAEHKKARKLLTTLQNVYGSQNDNKRSRPLGIVFCATIQKVQYLAKLLTKECSNRNNVIPSSAQLHSRLSQVDRERVVREFACGKVPLLLASDLAARGLDVRSVSFIVNYDFPGNLEQYVHRCGRAGRGSSCGNKEATATVYSFFTRNLAPLAADMMALLEAGQQVVDPNLRALVAVDSDHGAPRPAAKMVKRRADWESDRKSAQADEVQHHTIGLENSDDDSIDDLFQHFSAKRIVLTRAPGISEPSSSSDDDNSS